MYGSLGWQGLVLACVYLCCFLNHGRVFNLVQDYTVYIHLLLLTLKLENWIFPLVFIHHTVYRDYVLFCSCHSLADISHPSTEEKKAQFLSFA